MDENPDARQAIFEPSPANWRRPPGRPHTTWVKNIHDDLSSLDLAIYEARNLTQNRPLCKLKSLHSTTHWKLVAVVLRVARVTAGLTESNGSLLPGLWLMSPAGWLPRTGISSGTLCSVIEHGLPLLFLRTPSGAWRIWLVFKLHYNVQQRSTRSRFAPCRLQLLSGRPGHDRASCHSSWDHEADRNLAGSSAAPTSDACGTCSTDDITQRKCTVRGPIYKTSYDNLMIMPKLHSTDSGRLTYKTSYGECKDFLRYDSLSKMQDSLRWWVQISWWYSSEKF